MTVAILNLVGLFATTVASLITFLHLYRSERAMPHPVPAQCAAYASDRRRLTITMGLLSGWFVIQYAAAILL